MPRVLHVLTQRPGLTGSGVTLDALVRQAAAAGWEQRIVVGVPAGSARPQVGGLDAGLVDPLIFEDGALDFPVPGMSDVMPYHSTRFSSMTARQLGDYRQAWREHLGRVLAEFRPDVVHAHHVWIVSALLEDLAPGLPSVTHCHGTDLRQAALCPHLAAEVRAGCSRNDRFAVLHRGHAAELEQALTIAGDRIRVVGAGFDETLFHARGRREPPVPRLVYAGKYSAAKGLPALLDAFEPLAVRHPAIELHVAGSGAGPEAAALLERMRGMGPAVVIHGSLPQPRLAELFRECSVCVLPSFYEGLPLVLVEAVACGCRLVATRLPGIAEQLAGPLGPALDLVELPRMIGIDQPDPRELPSFVTRLGLGVERALARPPAGDAGLPAALATFRWSAVFRRVEAVWNELL